MNETNWLKRTELLIGQKNIEKLRQSHILVMGLGGVGAYAAEQICRAGIGEMTIIDGDTISITNRNRQLPALVSTVGKQKSVVIAERLRDINPQIKLNIISEYIDEKRMADIMKNNYDFVVDAIDTLSPKIHLIYYAVCNNLKLVSSMGSAGKIDPSQIKISDFSETYNCRLAFFLRKKLRKLGVTKGFNVVFSTEQSPKEAIIKVDEPNKRSVTGTISFIPAVFGCFCASVVIKGLIDK